jgi:hypothetical protein
VNGYMILLGALALAAMATVIVLACLPRHRVKSAGITIANWLDARVEFYGLGTTTPPRPSADGELDESHRDPASSR